MSRYYIQLECGCLVSCDGGGGLIPECGTFDEKLGNFIPSPNCKVPEYLKEHKFVQGYCVICETTAMKEEVKKYGTKAEKKKYLKGKI